MDKDNYHIHISSKHHLFDLKLKEVWRYRELIVLFAKKSFTVKYKQTILGPLWLFINPILSSGIYTIVFGHIARLSTDGAPKLLFYLCGNAIWGYFSYCLSSNASTFVGNAHLFGKVYFPRLTIPISNALISLLQFLIQMILVFVFIFYYYVNGMISINILSWLMIPVVLLQLGILGMGCGIIVSSLTTKYRDLSVLVSFGIQLWMYATPVVYPLSLVSDSFLKQLMLINPVTSSIEYMRYALLGVGSIHLSSMIISWIITLFVFFIGIVIFNKVERNFMDTV